VLEGRSLPGFEMSEMGLSEKFVGCDRKSTWRTRSVGSCGKLVEDICDSLWRLYSLDKVVCG